MLTRTGRIKQKVCTMTNSTYTISVYCNTICNSTQIRSYVPPWVTCYRDQQVSGLFLVTALPGQVLHQTYKNYNLVAGSLMIQNLLVKTAVNTNDEAHEVDEQLFIFVICSL